MYTVGKSARYYSGFNPTSIPGCALWFDAADPSTLSLTGTNITQWRDKSGRACNATGVNNPTYSNTTVNFLRTSSQHFTLPDGALPSGDSAYSYFVLCKFTNAAAASGLIGGGSFGTSRQVFAFRNMNGEIANNLLTYWWGADLVSPSNRYTLNTDIIAGSFYAPGVTSGRTMFVNGTQIASDTPGTRSQTISNNRIGTTNFTEYMSGSISEIVVYSNALATSQRQQIEGYLARKWGVTASLPATHLYRALPPFLRSFQPLDVSGCGLWLDAADRSVMTLSGPNITQWRDKSGNGYDVTFTTNPVYNSAYPQNVDSAQVTYSVSSNALTITAGQSGAFFIIYADKQTAPGNTILFGTGFSSESFYQSLLRTDGLNYRSIGGTDPDTAGRALFNTTAISILSFSYTHGTTTGTLRLNGSQMLSAYTYTVAPATNLNLGGVGYGDKGNVRIYEVLSYKRALPTSTFQQIEGYLATKWGLRGSIPSTHPFKLANALSIPFAPNQLPGCALWFDGADPGVLTLSGSNVTQWNDKSGNARHTNSVTGTPTWITNPINKQQGVYFNGSSHFYGDFTYSSNTLSSFVVATIESDGVGSGRLFSVCTTTAEDFGTALGMNVFSRIDLTTEIATYRNFSFAGRGMNITYATPFLVESILDGTSNAAFINGNSATGGATSGNFGFTRYAIANSAGTNNLQRNKGFIFEVVVYTSVLTQSQRQQVEGYLAWKWGLRTSVPTTHPYYRFNPS